MGGGGGVWTIGTDNGHENEVLYRLIGNQCDCTSTSTTLLCSTTEEIVIIVASTVQCSSNLDLGN